MEEEKQNLNVDVKNPAVKRIIHSEILPTISWPSLSRRALAVKSCETAQRFGSPDHRMLIYKIHQYMLNKAPPVPQLLPTKTSAEHSTNGESEAPQVDHQNTNAVAESVEIATNEDINDVIVEDRHEVHWNANAGPLKVSFSAGLRVSHRGPH
ncbi:hypothetical protein SO802_033839 [Lithocarpus litseifolius]|uniref:Uncharacterized protein n=1 Tax=Lithocarpus litseifolius TaxID=425828 RepID=A0AAW2BH42_9ROSI